MDDFDTDGHNYTLDYVLEKQQLIKLQKEIAKRNEYLKMFCYIDEFYDGLYNPDTYGIMIKNKIYAMYF